jgi:hypothetical protein
VLLPEGGQAERAVLVGVLRAARAEETEVGQTDRGGQDPLPDQAPGLHVVREDLAYVRQGGAEQPDPVMLIVVPLLPPQIVVAVLAAACGIGADGLDVALRIGADPHVLPGRRDNQGLDAGQDLRIADDGRIRPEVAEAAPAAPAQDARAGRIAAPQRTACPAAQRGRFLAQRHNASARPAAARAAATRTASPMADPFCCARRPSGYLAVTISNTAAARTGAGVLAARRVTIKARSMSQPVRVSCSGYLAAGYDHAFDRYRW